MPFCFHSETKKVILNVCSPLSLKSYWKEKELRAKRGSKLCDSTFFLFNQDILSFFTISILGKKMEKKVQLKTKVERNSSKKEGNLRYVNYTALFYCIDFVINHCQYSKWKFFAMLQFKENCII